MKYDKFKYIFPPRPEFKVSPNDISTFDDDSFIAEPKFNGSCGPIFFDENNFKPMTRHNSVLTTFKIKPSELKNLFSDKWNCVVGEYMNKSKKDENNTNFNHKLVIVDLIVFDGEHLLGYTYEERWLLLFNHFKENIISENEYSYQITENIWLCKIWYKDFINIFNKISNIDMIEGLVLKKKKSKLLPGDKEKNNYLSMVKIRKPTKNYNY